MTYYSPLAATYGVRVDQFLETAQDFTKYHAKLNTKLQKLRRRCRITTKDTKHYSSKEKYSKITSEDYDTKNKLFGALVLLHAERDLAFAEELKLKAHARGVKTLKKSEKKLLGTRLKKTVKTCERLLEITANETNWKTRLEFLIYSKLCRAEYLINGKHFKRKDASSIIQSLSLAFAGINHLTQEGALSQQTCHSITSKYEYSLTQYILQLTGVSVFSTKDLSNYITKQVKGSPDEEIVKVLTTNGFKAEEEDVEMDDDNKPVKDIHWRSFTATVNSNQVAQLLSEIHKLPLTDLSHYSDKLLKWEEVLEAQQQHIEQKHDSGEDDESEDDQILLTYINYNSHFTTIQRDDLLFQQLLKQWQTSKSSMASKLTKFKEIQRITNNLVTYLQEIMELPGVYSDDELLSLLELAKLYYQLYLNSSCLAALYQSSGKYLEALALYLDSYKKLTEKIGDDISLEVLPGDIVNETKLNQLMSLIKSGWSSVVALAEYEKSTIGSDKYAPSLLEKLGKNIEPKDVKLSTLFPLRPQIKPVGAKPTLFDLAFNYIDYDSEQQKVATNEIPHEQQKEQQQTPKKKGLFGIFGR